MKKIITTVLMIVYGSICVVAQNQSTQNLLLHLNKNIYNTGDVINFKCYVINNINHVGDDNNLYILLANNNGKIISKQKYPIFNSSANGTIVIPKELSSDKYTIAAFTPYLINNKVIKSNEIIVKNTTEALNTLPIQIKAHYADNKLISNIVNTFYVKTEDGNNIPTSCKVSITDKEGKEVKQFFTDANGVAKVNFTPLRYQEYNYTINGNKYALPKADSAGINMLVSFEKNIIDFLVSKNYKITPTQDAFTINAYQNNILVYTTNFSFENYSSISLGVNVASLPTGIITIELQNKDKATIASNLVYLQNAKNFEDIVFKNSANAALSKSMYELQFNQAASKYLSASIEKIDYKDSALNTNFDFYYTKSSNNTEQIVDFFETSSSSQKSKVSDYLILKPNTITAQKTNINLPKINDEYGTIIKGVVYDLNSDKALSNGYLNFTSETPDTVYNYTTKVKSDGSFILDSLFFSGKQKFIYQYYNSNNREVNAKIKLADNKNDLQLDTLITLAYGFTQPVQDKAEVVAMDTIASNKLNEPKNTKQASPVKNESYATGIYAGNSSFVIDNIKNPTKDGNMNGANFIKNRIPNIAFQGGNIVNTKNLSMGSGAYWIIGVVLDEIPVTVADLNVLTASDIAIVKFFEPGHVSVGSATPGGIIALYTKNKVLNNTNEKPGFTQSKPNIQVFEYTGFSNLVSPKNKINNYTNTFYWNPSIIIPKNQNSFSFETPKLESGAIYKLTIRGYNELGKFINIEKVLKD